MRFASPLWLLIALLAGASRSPVVALDLDTHVVSGGGEPSSAGRFHLDGSLGKPAAESEAAASDSLHLRSGFWSHVGRWMNVAAILGEDVLERRAGESGQLLIRTLFLNDVATDFERLELVSIDPTSDAGGQVYRDGPWILYEPPASGPDPVEDRFRYRVRDFAGMVETGTVWIRRALPPGGGPPNALGVEILTGPTPQIRVRFQAVPGRSYELETASSVGGPWLPLATLTAAANGSIFFTEEILTGPRFYRLVEPVAP